MIHSQNRPVSSSSSSPIHSFFVSPSSSVMPSAVRKQNRKPSNQKPPPAKPVQSQQPQPQQTSAAAVTPSASSSKSPAAKQVLKSTEPQSELIVYNVQLEDDGSPAQSKTVGPLYPPEFPGTPRLFFSFFLLADRSWSIFSQFACYIALTTPSSYHSLRTQNHDRCRNWSQSKRNPAHKFPLGQQAFRKREMVSSKVSSKHCIK